MLNGLLLAAGGFLITAFLLKKDAAIEDRRLGAINLAADAEREGLDFLAPALKRYAVGDYSGAIKTLYDLVLGLANPEKRTQAFAKLLDVQLGKHLDQPDFRRKVAGLIAAAETKAAHSATPPANGPPANGAANGS